MRFRDVGLLSGIVEGERPTVWHGFFFVMENGKTNQHGALEERVIFRSANVSAGSWSAIALLDFDRFHSGLNNVGADMLAHPDTTSPSAWYRLGMFPAPKDLQASLGYAARHTSMDRMVKDLNIHLVEGATR